MQENLCLQPCHSALHSTRGPVKLFGKPFDGHAVDEAALNNGAVTLGVDVFCNNERDATVGVLRL